MAYLLVPNGVYEIRNVEYSRVVADLINGVQGGPIMGYIDRPTNVNDKVCAVLCRGPYSLVLQWEITNVGGGGNEIIIESVSTPGNFASAEQFPGAELVGTGDNTVWTVVMVDVGFK
ncbi:hypothetical protein JVT61DRAFT_14728 [Boletus reticuloceps]|uniref:Uncharacterized protein n=1 Tax=Boletus reticuloceps TaxID=495285 RepID=A0A8I2YT91_9AGAM|nr:hypothetical protein JVT61DRAFT_14728 [Boletus reticuloceps]